MRFSRAPMALLALAAACAAPRAVVRVPPQAAEAFDPALPLPHPALPGDPWGFLAQALHARRLLDGPAEVEALLATARSIADGPLAVVSIRRLSELAEESPALATRVDTGIASLLESGKLSGVGAYRARVARALVSEVLGDPSGAARARAENGAVSAWTVAGPFSELRVLDFDEPIPPEKGEIPPEVAAPAGLPSTPSRALPAPDGTFSLDGEPPPGDVFALSSDVTLARGGSYLVALNTGDTVRLLLDGALLYERRGFAAWLPSVVYLPVELSPGTHRLVVKVSRTGGGGAISVSFARADGLVSDARFTAPAPGSSPPPPSPGALSGAPVATPRLLASALESGAGPVLARLLAARDALASDRESAKVLLSEARELAPGSASILVSLAEASVDDPTLDRRVAQSRAEAALRDALRADPGNAEARVRLSALLRATERADAADEILGALVAPAAARPPALAARARTAEARGLPERAEALAAQAMADPGSCDAADLLAALAHRRQALPRIDEALAVLAHCRGGLGRRVNELRQRGDAVGAEEALETALAVRPWDVDLALSRAEALLAAEKPREAAERVAALAVLWPRSARVEAALASALELSGDRPGARAARERALLLDGADLSLRRALALEDGGEVLDDLSEDARAAIRAYEAAGRRAGTSSVLVLDAAAVDIHPGGVATERTQQVIHVLDQAGVDEHGEISLPAGAEVIAARTIKPDGRVVEPERATDEKGSLSLSGLEPGDYVEVDYVRAVRAPFGALGYVADPFFFEAPRERLFHSTYVVRAWPGSGLAADAHWMPPPDVGREGGKETMRAERRDVPPFVPEPDEPGMSEVMPFVVAGTGATREAFQRSIADRLVGRTLPTVELVDLSRQVWAEAREKSPSGLARAAYAWVARTILGDGPLLEDASHVLSRGRGSRLLVLQALLEELGLEARIALVRPFSVDPSAYRFYTAALYPAQVLRVRVGGEVVWLDPSTRMNPFGAIPDSIAGCEALVLPHPGEPLSVDRTPGPSGQDRVESELRIELAQDGSGTLAGVDRFTGTLGAALKAQLEPLDLPRRRQAVESLLTRTFQGVAVSEVLFEGEGDPDAPLAIRWRGRSAQLARPVDGGLVLEAGTQRARLSAKYVRIAARTTPLLIGSPERSSAMMELFPPKGAHVVVGPPARVTTPYGSYERTENETKGGGLVRAERLEVARGRIPPEAYHEFAAFAAAVDAVQDQPIPITWSGGDPGSPHPISPD